MIGEPETSLRDDLASAFDAANNDTLPDSGGADILPDAGALDATAELGTAPLPALEAPAMWGPKYKEAFSKLAGTPEQRESAEAWLNHYKEQQGYATKKEQEAADLRKQFDPIREVLSPYEGYWQRQGMDTRQGLSQLLGWGQALASNPQQTLMELAKLYQVNLAEATAAQPYVDPAYQKLEQQYQTLQQQLQTVQQYPQQQEQNRVLEQLKAFETATDEQGNPKHPYYSQVFDQMVGLARGGLTQSVEDAYAKAVAMNPDIQGQITQKRDAEAAVTRAAEAKKAAEASRTVRSKSGGDLRVPDRGLRDDISATAAAMGFN
jgi:hypothetical protein